MFDQHVDIAKTSTEAHTLRHTQTYFVNSGQQLENRGNVAYGVGGHELNQTVRIDSEK